MLTVAAIKHCESGSLPAFDLIYCDTCGCTRRDVVSRPGNGAELSCIPLRDAVCCELQAPPANWLEDWM